MPSNTKLIKYIKNYLKNIKEANGDLYNVWAFPTENAFEAKFHDDDAIAEQAEYTAQIHKDFKSLMLKGRNKLLALEVATIDLLEMYEKYEKNR